jgi:hypothetical protein
MAHHADPSDKTWVAAQPISWPIFLFTLSFSWFQMHILYFFLLTVSFFEMMMSAELNWGLHGMGDACEPGEEKIKL